MITEVGPIEIRVVPKKIREAEEVYERHRKLLRFTAILQAKGSTAMQLLSIL